MKILSVSMASAKQVLSDDEAAVKDAVTFLSATVKICVGYRG